MLSESLKIRFDTPRHRMVKTALLDRLNLARNEFRTRHEDWKSSEELYQAYTEKNDEETTRQQEIEDGENTFSKINISYSYAILLTAHTYWSSVFLSRNPVNQFMARHGEPQNQVLAVEALMDYQVQRGGMMVPYFNWLLDAGKYGLGVVSNYWCEEFETVSRYETQELSIAGVPVFGKTRKNKITEKIRGYAGNKIFNVRPYDFFPDPRVSLTDFQTGEFCGHVDRIGWNEIKKREATGEFFNIKQLEQSALKNDGGTSERETGFEENIQPWESTTLDQRTSPRSKSFVDVFVCVVELIPRDWELAESDAPEKWAFVLANESIVIGARPLGEYHNSFPYNILSYEMDPYQNYLRGILQIGRPINDTISWLMNSHFFNVRKSLNDMLVVDPARVYMKDLTDGGAGRIIRLRNMAYGTKPGDAVQQLAVQDITRANVADAEIMVQFLQRIFGVNDTLMGAVNPEGKTATEVRASSSAGTNRMKTFCEYNSALGFSPLSQMMLQSTQQHYDGDQQYRIVGDLSAGMPTFARITPEDILGFFDFVPVDGTFPIDRFAQANLWKEVLMGLGKMPQIAAQYDLAKIFSWMARLAGLRNIDQMRNPQGPAQMPGINVMPDQQIAAGNGGMPLPPVV